MTIRQHILLRSGLAVGVAAYAALLVVLPRNGHDRLGTGIVCAACLATSAPPLWKHHIRGEAQVAVFCHWMVMVGILLSLCALAL